MDRRKAPLREVQSYHSGYLTNHNYLTLACGHNLEERSGDCIISVDFVDKREKRFADIGITVKRSIVSRRRCAECGANQ